MKYRIEISSVAEAEADSTFLRLSQVTSAMKKQVIRFSSAIAHTRSCDKQSFVESVLA